MYISLNLNGKCDMVQVGFQPMYRESLLKPWKREKKNDPASLQPNWNWYLLQSLETRLLAEVDFFPVGYKSNDIKQQLAL